MIDILILATRIFVPLILIKFITRNTHLKKEDIYEDELR